MQIGQLKQLKQRYGRTVQIGATLAAGLLLMATALRPQMPAVGPVWEYSTVTYSPEGGTAICYAAASGCRYERPGGDSGRSAEAAMIAAANLGEKGWELATTTEVATGTRRERVLYFRRLKSVLNRPDSPGAR